jgi:hypothetical protein
MKQQESMGMVEGLGTHIFLAIVGKHDGKGLPNGPTPLWKLLIFLFILFGVFRAMALQGTTVVGFGPILAGILIVIIFYFMGREKKYILTSVLSLMGIGISIAATILSSLGIRMAFFFMLWEILAMTACWIKIHSDDPSSRNNSSE